MADKIYKEKQYFMDINLRWMLAGIGAISLLILLRVYLDPAIKFHFSDLVNGLLAIGLLLATLWFMLSLRLKSAITDRGIEYKMKPFHQKKRIIPWEQIRKINITRAPRHYSWQKRYNSYLLQKKYTFSGRNGISIETTDGEIIFIGSRHVSELQDALERAQYKFHLNPAG